MKENKKKSKKTIVIVATLSALIIIVSSIAANIAITNYKRSKSEPEIITEANLKRIINVSELSTYESIYNGIAKVTNAEKTEKIDYYVAYEATVRAGVDLSLVDISVDNENKSILINLPQVKINDITVDMQSIDIIAESRNVENKKDILSEAYQKCIEDVKSETLAEDAIVELATNNAKNILEALIKPFINQLDTEYSIHIA